MLDLRNAATVLVYVALASVLPGRAAAQDFYHPIPWEESASVRCVAAPTTRTRAELDAALVATRGGERPVPALELIARCDVPRREIAQAFNEGGLVRHRAADYAGSAASFTDALIADPSSLPARFNLACALARLGQGEAALSELAQLARAGDAARTWLRRVRTDPDLDPLLRHEELPGLLSGEWSGAGRPMLTSRLAPPAPAGPIWEPVHEADWAPFRELVIASGRYGDRQAIQRAGQETFTHPDVAALERFASPAWWRPEPGYVFLVIPFTIPGPNHRDGMLVLAWTGTAYTPACHEYCSELGEPMSKHARFRSDARADALDVLACRGESVRCVRTHIRVSGRVARYGNAAIVEGVTR